MPTELLLLVVLRLLVAVSNCVIERPACFSRYGQGELGWVAMEAAVGDLSVLPDACCCWVLLMLLRLLLKGSTMYFSIYSVALKVGMARWMRDKVVAGTMAERCRKTLLVARLRSLRCCW